MNKNYKSNKKWRSAHPIQSRAASKKWYKKNKKKVALCARKWRVLHPRHDAVRTHAYKLMRADFMWQLKAAPCVDCGGSFPPECMDFDHKAGMEKVKSISALTCSHLILLLFEIGKCDLVCANCHRIRTKRRWYE